MAKLNGGARRPGYMLVYGLVITIVGAGLALGILSLSRLTHTTDIISRSNIEMEIDVDSIIEEAKGMIVRANIVRSNDLTSETPGLRAGVVLHGASEDVNNLGYFNITDLNGLLIDVPELPELNRDLISLDSVVRTPSGTPYLARRRVYDANYDPSKVNLGNLTRDFPPSMWRLNRVNSEGGSAGEFTDPTVGDSTSSEPGRTHNDSTNGFSSYRQYGAYLIRVDVYRRDDPKHIVSRTEEMFYMFLPNYQ